MNNDEKLQQEFMREIKQLEQSHMTVRLSLTPTAAMALIATVQLACRHPEFKGDVRRIAERLVDRLQEEFLQYQAPNTIEVIQRGWMPDHDQAKGDLP
jgi:glutamate-1-semialdehyde aminotransferase